MSSDDDDDGFIDVFALLNDDHANRTTVPFISSKTTTLSRRGSQTTTQQTANPPLTKQLSTSSSSATKSQSQTTASVLPTTTLCSSPSSSQQSSISPTTLYQRVVNPFYNNDIDRFPIHPPALFPPTFSTTNIPPSSHVPNQPSALPYTPTTQNTQQSPELNRDTLHDAYTIIDTNINTTQHRSALNILKMVSKHDEALLQYYEETLNPYYFHNIVQQGDNDHYALAMRSYTDFYYKKLDETIISMNINTTSATSSVENWEKNIKLLEYFASLFGEHLSSISLSPDLYPISYVTHYMKINQIGNFHASQPQYNSLLGRNQINTGNLPDQNNNLSSQKPHPINLIEQCILYKNYSAIQWILNAFFSQYSPQMTPVLIDTSTPLSSPNTSSTTTLPHAFTITSQYSSNNTLSLQALINIYTDKRKTQSQRKFHHITPFPLWFSNNVRYQPKFITFDVIYRNLYQNYSKLKGFVNFLEFIIQSLCFVSSSYTSLNSLIVTVNTDSNISRKNSYISSDTHENETTVTSSHSIHHSFYVSMIHQLISSPLVQFSRQNDVTTTPTHGYVSSTTPGAQQQQYYLKQQNLGSNHSQMKQSTSMVLNKYADIAELTYINDNTTRMLWNIFDENLTLIKDILFIPYNYYNTPFSLYNLAFHFVESIKIPPPVESMVDLRSIIGAHKNDEDSEHNDNNSVVSIDPKRNDYNYNILQQFITQNTFLLPPYHKLNIKYNINKLIDHLRSIIIPYQKTTYLTTCSSTDITNTTHNSENIMESDENPPQSPANTYNYQDNILLHQYTLHASTYSPTTTNGYNIIQYCLKYNNYQALYIIIHYFHSIYGILPVFELLLYSLHNPININPNIALPTFKIMKPSHDIIQGHGFSQKGHQAKVNENMDDLNIDSFLHDNHTIDDVIAYNQSITDTVEYMISSKITNTQRKGNENRLGLQYYHYLWLYSLTSRLMDEDGQLSHIKNVNTNLPKYNNDDKFSNPHFKSPNKLIYLEQHGNVDLISPSLPSYHTIYNNQSNLTLSKQLILIWTSVLNTVFTHYSLHPVSTSSLSSSQRLSGSSSFNTTTTTTNDNVTSKIIPKITYFNQYSEPNTIKFTYELQSYFIYDCLLQLPLYIKEYYINLFQNPQLVSDQLIQIMTLLPMNFYNNTPRQYSAPEDGELGDIDLEIEKAVEHNIENFLDSAQNNNKDQIVSANTSNDVNIDVMSTNPTSLLLSNQDIFPLSFHTLYLDTEVNIETNEVLYQPHTLLYMLYPHNHQNTLLTTEMGPNLPKIDIFNKMCKTLVYVQEVKINQNNDVEYLILTDGTYTTKLHGDGSNLSRINKYTCPLEKSLIMYYYKILFHPVSMDIINSFVTFELITPQCSNLYFSKEILAFWHVCEEYYYKTLYFQLIPQNLMVKARPSFSNDDSSDTDDGYLINSDDDEDTESAQGSGSDHNSILEHPSAPPRSQISLENTNSIPLYEKQFENNVNLLVSALKSGTFDEQYNNYLTFLATKKLNTMVNIEYQHNEIPNSDNVIDDKDVMQKKINNELNPLINEPSLDSPYRILPLSIKDICESLQLMKNPYINQNLTEKRKNSSKNGENSIIFLHCKDVTNRLIKLCGVVSTIPTKCLVCPSTMNCHLIKLQHCDNSSSLVSPNLNFAQNQHQNDPDTVSCDLHISQNLPFKCPQQYDVIDVIVLVTIEAFHAPIPQFSNKENNIFISENIVHNQQSIKETGQEDTSLSTLLNPSALKKQLSSSSLLAPFQSLLSSKNAGSNDQVTAVENNNHNNIEQLPPKSGNLEKTNEILEPLGDVSHPSAPLLDGSAPPETQYIITYKIKLMAPMYCNVLSRIKPLHTPVVINPHTKLPISTNFSLVNAIKNNAFISTHMYNITKYHQFYQMNLTQSYTRENIILMQNNYIIPMTFHQLSHFTVAIPTINPVQQKPQVLIKNTDINLFQKLCKTIAIITNIEYDDDNHERHISDNNKNDPENNRKVTKISLNDGTDNIILSENNNMSFLKEENTPKIGSLVEFYYNISISSKSSYHSGGSSPNNSWEYSYHIDFFTIVSLSSPPQIYSINNNDSECIYISPSTDPTLSPIINYNKQDFIGYLQHINNTLANHHQRVDSYYSNHHLGNSNNALTPSAETTSPTNISSPQNLQNNPNNNAPNFPRRTVNPIIPLTLFDFSHSIRVVSVRDPAHPMKPPSHHPFIGGKDIGNKLVKIVGYIEEIISSPLNYAIIRGISGIPLDTIAVNNDGSLKKPTNGQNNTTHQTMQNHRVSRSELIEEMLTASTSSNTSELHQMHFLQRCFKKCGSCIETDNCTRIIINDGYYRTVLHVKTPIISHNAQIPIENTSLLPYIMTNNTLYSISHHCVEIICKIEAISPTHPITTPISVNILQNNIQLINDHYMVAKMSIAQQLGAAIQRSLPFIPVPEQSIAITSNLPTTTPNPQIIKEKSNTSQSSQNQAKNAHISQSLEEDVIPMTFNALINHTHVQNTSDGAAVHLGPNLKLCSIKKGPNKKFLKFIAKVVEITYAPGSTGLQQVHSICLDDATAQYWIFSPRSALDTLTMINAPLVGQYVEMYFEPILDEYVVKKSETFGNTCPVKLVFYTYKPLTITAIIEIFYQIKLHHEQCQHHYIKYNYHTTGVIAPEDSSTIEDIELLWLTHQISTPFHAIPLTLWDLKHSIVYNSANKRAMLWGMTDITNCLVEVISVYNSDIYSKSLNSDNTEQSHENNNNNNNQNLIVSYCDQTDKNIYHQQPQCKKHCITLTSSDDFTYFFHNYKANNSFSPTTMTTSSSSENSSEQNPDFFEELSKKYYFTQNTRFNYKNSTNDPLEPYITHISKFNNNANVPNHISYHTRDNNHNVISPVTNITEGLLFIYNNNNYTNNNQKSSKIRIHSRNIATTPTLIKTIHHIGLGKDGVIISTVTSSFLYNNSNIITPTYFNHQKSINSGVTTDIVPPLPKQLFDLIEQHFINYQLFKSTLYQKKNVLLPLINLTSNYDYTKPVRNDQNCKEFL